LVKMRMGGKSNRNLKNLLIKSYEDYRAWKVNNLSGGISVVLCKNLVKIPQFIKKR
jgi:glycosyltransferase